MTEWLKHRLRCESRNSSISYFDAILFLEFCLCCRIHIDIIS